MTESGFQTVQRPKQLSSQVEAEIESSIRQRWILPGSKLPSEQKLCEQFGVSRTAVREAIRMLSARGLVEVKKGKGVYVKQVSAANVSASMHLYLELAHERSHVMDIVHARQIIEPPIAASAAAHRTDEDITRLEQDIRELSECNGTFQELAAIDMRFHLNIARASDNSIVPLILDPIHRLLPQIKSSVYASVEDAKSSALEWHARILDEIRNGRSEGARLAMAEHLSIAETHAKKMLEAATPGSVKGKNRRSV